MSSRYHFDLLHISPAELWKIHKTLLEMLRDNGYKVAPIDIDSKIISSLQNFTEYADRLRKEKFKDLIEKIKRGKDKSSSSSSNKKKKTASAKKDKEKKSKKENKENKQDNQSRHGGDDEAKVRGEELKSKGMPQALIDSEVRDMEEESIVVKKEKRTRSKKKKTTKKATSGKDDNMSSFETGLTLYGEKPNHKLAVFFAIDVQIGTAAAKQLRTFLRRSGDITDVVVVTKGGFTSFAKDKIMRKLQAKYSIRTFLQSELIVNITKHKLAQPHTLVSNEKEQSELMETYKIASWQELPKLRQNDPMSMYYDFKVGDLVRIDHLAARPTYRLVIEPSV